MSFIAKNPLNIPKISSTPPIPKKGTRGIFAKNDGWYEIDDTGNVIKIANINDTQTYSEKTEENAKAYADEQSKESIIKSTIRMEKYTDYTGFGMTETSEGTHMRIVVNASFFNDKIGVASPSDLKLSNYILLIKRKDLERYFTARILGYENRSDGNFTLRYEQNEYGISSGMEGFEYFNLVDEVYFCLMSEDAEKALKKYSDSRVEEAKAYADSKDTANLKAAKAYTDEQLSGLKDDIYVKSYTTKDITGAKLGTGSDDYRNLTLVDNNGIDRISINYNGWENVYLYLKDSDGNTLYKYYLNAPGSYDYINKVIYPKVEGVKVSKIYIQYSDRFEATSIDYTYYDEPIITDELAHEKYTDNALNTAKAYTDEKIAEILKLLGNA